MDYMMQDLEDEDNGITLPEEMTTRVADIIPKARRTNNVLIETLDQRSSVRQLKKAPHALFDLYRGRNALELKRNATLHDHPSAKTAVETVDEYTQFVEGSAETMPFRGPDVIFKTAERKDAVFVPQRDIAHTSFRSRRVSRTIIKAPKSDAMLTSMVELVPWERSVIRRTEESRKATFATEANGPMVAASVVNSDASGLNTWAEMVARTPADSAKVVTHAKEDPLEIDLASTVALRKAAARFMQRTTHSARDKEEEEHPSFQDIFNISQDAVYRAWRKGANVQAVFRSGHSAIVIAIASLAPTGGVGTRMEWMPKPDYWLAFHRRRDLLQRLTGRMLLSRGRPHEVSAETDVSTVTFPDHESLSVRDGRTILVEYYEQHPHLLTSVGMVSSLHTLCVGNSTAPPLAGAVSHCENNEIAVKDNILLGRLPTNSATTYLQNNLGVTPVVHETTRSVDFLLVLNPTASQGRGVRMRHGVTAADYEVRPCPYMFAAGQTVPKRPVFDPKESSKSARAEFNKNLVRVFCHRLQGEQDDVRRIEMTEVRDNVAPDLTTTRLNEIMSQFAQKKEHVPGGHNKIAESTWEMTESHPSEIEIASMLTPEDFCLNESMRAGQYRLIQWLRKVKLDAHIFNILANVTDHTSSRAVERLIDLARLAQFEFATMPWIQTELFYRLQNRLRDRNLTSKQCPEIITRAHLIRFPGNNWIKGGHGIMLLNVAHSGSSHTTPLARMTRNIVTCILEGRDDDLLGNGGARPGHIKDTSSDLRAMDLSQIKTNILRLGQTEKDLADFERKYRDTPTGKPHRWDWVHYLKNLSTEKTAMGDAGFAAKYARGGRAGTMVNISDLTNALTKLLLSQFELLKGDVANGDDVVAAIKGRTQLFDANDDDDDDVVDFETAGMKSAEATKPRRKRASQAVMKPSTRKPTALEKKTQSYAEIERIRSGKKVLTVVRKNKRVKSEMDTITVTDPNVMVAFFVLQKQLDVINTATKDLAGANTSTDRAETRSMRRGRSPRIEIQDILRGIVEHLLDWSSDCLTAYGDEGRTEGPIKLYFENLPAKKFFPHYYKMIPPENLTALSEIKRKFSQGDSKTTADFIKKIRQMLVNAYAFSDPKQPSSWTTAPNEPAPRKPDGVLAAAEIIRRSVVKLLLARREELEGLETRAEREVQGREADEVIDRVTIPIEILERFRESDRTGPGRHFSFIGTDYPLFRDLFGTGDEEAMPVIPG
ncbi:Protein of unknown function (DUF3591) [Carpediemonas membranifera]|uniref:Bromo domain-containing protein n=1 Tax=Carpediemonas membranifera TaxID=201153 RepID=A0A8J6B3B5_9EUKA|nr:Protein of unknown function (DUF3591) [Carpediemonas membranifera]|eukprot:KAG9393394.1 Protein of unknown function (DUF3591) [Carpediemonas membranifera]